MWTMYALQAPGGGDLPVLVVDDDDLPVFFGPDPQEAATWLGAVGQRQVAIVTGVAREVYGIVASDPAALPPQALARPQALLVPSNEVDRPIRDATEARHAIGLYRSRRFTWARRRHRRKEARHDLVNA